MAVFAAGIGLPDLDQRARHRPSILVQHLAVDDDPLTDGLAVGRIIADQVVVERIELGVTEDRSGPFTDRLRQMQQGTARRAVSRRLVARRIRRRMPGAIAAGKPDRLTHRLPFRAAPFRFGGRPISA